MLVVWARVRDFATSVKIDLYALFCAQPARDRTAAQGVDDPGAEERLDCPEIDTADGKAAKRFVERLVADAKAITVHTTKPDKYDRYLADVFVETRDGEDVFLNNVLLEQGHAERKDAWEFGDWETLKLK